MPRKTPEEKAELLKNLKESDPEIKQLKALKAIKERQWTDEIAMLERRVQDKVTYIDLGDGDKLAIRACLSNAEMTEIARLEKRQRNLGKERTIPDPENQKAAPRVIRELSEKDNEVANEITFQILELVTANPLLTKEWFQANQARFALGDMLTVIMGYYENRVEEIRMRTERVKSATSFRKEPKGPELRGVPALSGDSGPERMGGTP